MLSSEGKINYRVICIKMWKHCLRMHKDLEYIFWRRKLYSHSEQVLSTIDEFHFKINKFI